MDQILFLVSQTSFAYLGHQNYPRTNKKWRVQGDYQSAKSWCEFAQISQVMIHPGRYLDGAVCHFDWNSSFDGWSPSLSIDYNTALSDNKTEKVKSRNLVPVMLAPSFLRQRRQMRVLMERWQRQVGKSLKSFATCWHDWKCLQSNWKSSSKNNVTCQPGAFGTLVINWCSPFQAFNAITVLLGIQFNFRVTCGMQRKLQTIKEGNVHGELEHLLDLNTQDIDPA